MSKPNSLNLQPGQVICSRHGELFRARWPKGYSEFTQIAFSTVMMDPVFIREVKRAAPNNKIQEELAAIKRLLRVWPLCCRLTPVLLLGVYAEVQLREPVWALAACDLCGKVRQGASFRRKAPNGEGFLKDAHPHVCLECVCFSG